MSSESGKARCGDHWRTLHHLFQAPYLLLLSSAICNSLWCVDCICALLLSSTFFGFELWFYSESGQVWPTWRFQDQEHPSQTSPWCCHEIPAADANLNPWECARLWRGQIRHEQVWSKSISTQKLCLSHEYEKNMISLARSTWTSISRPMPKSEYCLFPRSWENITKTLRSWENKSFGWLTAYMLVLVLSSSSSQSCHLSQDVSAAVRAPQPAASSVAHPVPQGNQALDQSEKLGGTCQFDFVTDWSHSKAGLLGIPMGLPSRYGRSHGERRRSFKAHMVKSFFQSPHNFTSHFSSHVIALQQISSYVMVICGMLHKLQTSLHSIVLYHMSSHLHERFMLHHTSWTTSSYFIKHFKAYSITGANFMSHFITHANCSRFLSPC